MKHFPMPRQSGRNGKNFRWLFFREAKMISIPLVTVPNAAYCPSRKWLVVCTMKNCELALFGSIERAIDKYYVAFNLVNLNASL